MSVNLKGGDDQATSDNIRHGLRVLPILIANSAILFATHGLKGIARMSDVQSIGNPTGEPQNERNHFEAGKKYLKTNDGINWSIPISFEGNHMSSVAAMLLQDLHTTQVMYHGQQVTRQFDLILYSVQDGNGNVDKVDCYFDFGASLFELPGLEDGETTYNIECFGLEDSKVARVYGGNTIGYEIFYDNGGSWLDPAAPNAVNLTFTLGDSKDAYAAAAPPDILIANPDGTTDLQKYFFKARLNGNDITDAEATFNSTTKVLTFVAAPPVNAKLELWYLVDQAGVGPAGQPPHLHAGSSFLTDWKTWQTT